MVYFNGAVFSGGLVKFDGAVGTAPNELLSAVGSQVPERFNLPSAWLSPNP
ncbi:hypothetical protein [Streptomyces sp. SP18CS02]|uniref:hypothetical protein n=1 Tax=Streptomyces sp. SP18CS02 TaxID=3002531 RepID=UPI002E780FED|nr:hypothetical protein [Streptomyces sp. SP18CS02]MEE1750985.1 hypothetical protein [Streptomyces sp. SP18CS02]